MLAVPLSTISEAEKTKGQSINTPKLDTTEGVGDTIIECCCVLQ